MNTRNNIILESFNLGKTAEQFAATQGINIPNIPRVPTLIGLLGKIPSYNSPPDPAPYVSQLGTPVWDSFIIKAGDYIDSIDGTVQYGEGRFDSCLITVTQVHNVIVTPIQGRDGEVIEYVSKGSFRINVKGGVFGNNNRRPTSAISQLFLMLGSNKPLVVKDCKFLGEWGITQITILDKNIPQMPGGYNYQLFEFNAIQDIPVILAQRGT